MKNISHYRKAIASALGGVLTWVASNAELDEATKQLTLTFDLDPVSMAVATIALGTTASVYQFSNKAKAT